MTRYARLERHALADLLIDLGPDRPTLCEGWTTRDLAAHLVTRERRPVAAAGLMVRSLQEHGERVRRSFAARPYPELVGMVRAGAWWSLLSNPLLDSLVNTLEFFIHHEDVRRAQPDWQPRSLPQEEESKLWTQLRTIGGRALRKSGTDGVVQAPGYGELRVGTGDPEVRLTGAPSELTLFLTGRQRAARIDLDGPEQTLERLRTARLGM